MDFVTGLPISTDWKGTSYYSILAVVDGLMKMIHYKPVQISRCTRACGGLFRPYNPTRPSTASSTRLHFEAQSSSPSTGLFCAAA